MAREGGARGAPVACRFDLERSVDDIITHFANDAWTVGVIGLGYVGLPLAVTASERGLGVIGFDVATTKVEALGAGVSHVEDVTDDALRAALERGARFTTDASELAQADAIVIAVPSPLGRSRQPDMRYIEAAAATVEEVARAGQLISLESTTYPGTTEDYLIPAVERAGLTLDKDVFICFSPERVDPGNPLATHQIPKVVGGVTSRSGEVAAAAYGRLVDNVHVVSSARAAELTKLLENTYRAVNIALVNEMAQLAHVFDIDIWEVIDAAATKPFGFQAFYPGPGVGGHCIPLDPQYLAWRARELRATTRFIDLAEDVNRHMPDYVAGRILDELNTRGLPAFGTPILGVGLAYKPNVGDDRESPALDVLEGLARRGAEIGVLDPHVPPERLAGHGYEVVGHDADFTSYAAAVVLTDHADLPYERLAAEVPLVFDTRGAYRRRGLEAPNVVSL
jgi:UDP-N-acetyl-D-glucosamine dehydrogenase